MESRRFSPRDFMRARRPERFSDSVSARRQDLDRAILEYHLDTLTNRKEETDFEVFARKLAEREICPNLLPQTGPTGGGDSRVDAETYPVADGLAVGWYVGIGNTASSERWAFAFSAKKDWRAKVQADVDKIAATKRGYTKAFFISNQFISDRNRSVVEDELSKKYHMDIRILDRSWILDRVFQNGHQALAIETLRLSIPIRNEVTKGPNDTRRERELAEVESRIADGLQQPTLALVDDCIRSVILSRSLERPAIETEGRIRRAERISGKYGTRHQQIEALYDGAWTAYWWYEDFDLFLELYPKIEALIVGSGNPYHLELLKNLWSILHTCLVHGKVDEGKANVEAHTRTLTSELERLRAVDNRPSASLQAQTLLMEIRLQLQAMSGESPDPILREMAEVVDACKGLVGYPLQPLVEIVTGLGEFLGKSKSYDDLFEVVLRVAGSRTEETTAARMLLRRGAQKLQSDLPYEAIQFLGRALTLLAKEETREDFVRALYLCGCAYERVGLLWAARGTILTGASVATDEYWRYGNITAAQLACYRRLKWLELQLGRLPHTLEWHEVGTVTEQAMISRKGKGEEPSEEAHIYDAVLGLLILKARLESLGHLSRLPDVLDRLGLPLSAIALRYALGYEEEVPHELLERDGRVETPLSFFTMWRNQPADADLPREPALYIGDCVTLESAVLGCTIVVESENRSPCVDIAESILASIESFLATAVLENLVAHEPRLLVSVCVAPDSESAISYELEDRAGVPIVKIKCSQLDVDDPPRDLVQQVSGQITEIVATVTARIIVSDRLEHSLEKMIRDEKAMERAASCFTSSLIVAGNVLGSNRKKTIAAWTDSRARDYSPRRAIPWDNGIDTVRGLGNTSEGPDEAKNEEFTGSLVNLSRTTHQQMVTVSLIRESLWDQAGWCGMGFLTSHESEPILALVFTDGAAGKAIFQGWHSELGETDTEDRIRITLIRGVDRKNPHAYRVVVGSELDAQSTKRYTQLFVVSRIHRMDPDSSTNLERFLESYGKFGKYMIAAAVLNNGRIRPLPIPPIKKSRLYVREAWQIGRHDPDSVGIREDEEPIIPAGEQNPPVVELLRWMRGQQGSPQSH